MVLLYNLVMLFNLGLCYWRENSMISWYNRRLVSWCFVWLCFHYRELLNVVIFFVKCFYEGLYRGVDLCGWFGSFLGGGGGSLSTGLNLVTVGEDFSQELLEEEFPWFCGSPFTRRFPATSRSEVYLDLSVLFSRLHET